MSIDSKFSHASRFFSEHRVEFRGRSTNIFSHDIFWCILYSRQLSRQHFISELGSKAAAMIQHNVLTYICKNYHPFSYQLVSHHLQRTNTLYPTHPAVVRAFSGKAIIHVYIYKYRNKLSYPEYAIQNFSEFWCMATVLVYGVCVMYKTCLSGCVRTNTVMLRHI